MTARTFRRSLIVAFFLSACSSVFAVQTGIGRTEIEQAIRLSRAPAAERQRYHERYSVLLNHHTVVGLEVVSEFRRVELRSEERIGFGDGKFDATAADQFLKPWRGRVSVVVHLRFNPQNSFASVPKYEVFLTGPRGTKDITPIEVQQKPVYSGNTLVSADLEAVFDAASVPQAKRTIVVRLAPGQLAAGAFDFSAVQ